MNAWALKRKRIILFIVFIALLIIVGVPAYFFFQKAPTCTDGKMDGDEAGVDCGGSCTVLCTSESLPLILKGDARVLDLGDGRYEVAAVVQNPNVSADIFKASYSVSVYSAGTTTPLRTITDSTYVPANATFAIFAGPFGAASSTPVRASFAWDQSTFVWRKGTAPVSGLSVADAKLASASTTSRLDATLTDTSLSTYSNIELVALLSGPDGNIFAASKTLVESLGAGQSTAIVFTWPFAVASTTSAEILPRVLPDPSFIR